MTTGDTVHIVGITKRKAFYEGTAQIVRVLFNWLENSQTVIDAEVRFADGCVERRVVYADRQTDPKRWVDRHNRRNRK